MTGACEYLHALSASLAEVVMSYARVLIAVALLLTACSGPDQRLAGPPPTLIPASLPPMRASDCVVYALLDDKCTRDWYACRKGEDGACVRTWETCCTLRGQGSRSGVTLIQPITRNY
jgi:hypothetical protein